MNSFLILKTLFSNTKYSFFFTLCVYLASLVFNTSFRIMGFDLSSQILNSININFLIIIFFTHIKIFLLYFIFFASLEFILKSIYDLTNVSKERYLPYFILFSVFLWLDSVVRYPQIYADFFYAKHPYLLTFLYLITDYFPIQVSFFILFFIILILLIFFVFQFFKTFDFQNFIIIIFILSFAWFHSIGSLVGLIFSFILAKYFYKFPLKFSKIYYIPLSISFLLLGWNLIYFKYFFSFQGETNEPIKILLISADSLRKDRISKLRNNESITPNIDLFLKDAFSFEDHHVTIPRTFPSWADLLTGHYSMSHKVRDMFPAPNEVANIGSEDFPTLGQYLQEKNVNTAVFSNFAGDIFPRANFGFERVEAPTFNAKILLVQKSLESQIFLLPILTGSFLGGGRYFEEIDSFASFGDGKRILNNLLPFLRTYKNKNFFITAFFSVTHFPYSPPYPFYKKYTKQNYKGDYKYFKFVDPTKDEKPSAEDIEQIEAIFDASINSFDYDFGTLIQFLKEEGIYHDTLIILTGDHGESLYEDVHGHGHGEHLRGENVTHVPLIIKFPLFKSVELQKQCSKLSDCQQINAITSAVDILPTILDFYNISPKTELAGRSLLPLISNKVWKDERMIYCETGIWFSDIGEHFFQKQRIMYPNILNLHRIVPEEDYQIMITDPFYRDTIAFAKHRAILTSKLKLIYIPTHDGVIYEVYDRIKDPLNQKNIYNSYTHLKLKTELFRLVQMYEKAEILGGYIVPPEIE